MEQNQNKVKELREHKGWSQDHLAEASGLSLRTIQRIESGRQVSGESLICVAAALDVKVEELSVNQDRNKWIFAIIFLIITFLIAIPFSWLVYQDDLVNQNRFILNYRIFLMFLSLISGIIWGITGAEIFHNSGNKLKRLGIFCLGTLLISICFETMPYIKYPYDQYAATFQWIATGLVPIVFTFGFLIWVRDDWKAIFDLAGRIG